MLDNYISIRPAGTQGIGEILWDVVLEENFEDALEVTEHPVERGASISDHAYKRPAQVSIRAGVWEGSSKGGLMPGRCQEVYDRLLELQRRREPFDVSTGRRLYKNMLLTSLSVSSDPASAGVLLVQAGCREVLIVESRKTSLPANSRHAEPSRTASPADMGSRQALPAKHAATEVSGPRLSKGGLA